MSQMSPEQWKRVSELFQAARDKTGGERLALLDSACSEDPWTCKVVEQMLRDDEAACSFLNESPFSSGKSTPSLRVIAGLKFGRYEIVAPIGRGGMGEVWKGHDPELDRMAALKFLTPETALGGSMDRLTREARAASALNHPNIVTVYEVIRHEDSAVIAMELVDGTSIREICGTAQSPHRVTQIGIQIAKALSAAHSHHIVHCDIKPENIVMRSDGYIKVLDFGLAHRVETQSATVALAGTLRYMSPEQAHSEPLTPATDIYSFGLVLYELAAGSHAFPNESTFESGGNATAKDPVAPSKLNPAIPKKLDLLILAMLATDPRERPTADEVGRTLSELQQLLENPAPEQKASVQLKWITAGALGLATVCAVWFWNYYQVAYHRLVFRQVTTLVPENRATAAAVSPDGKKAAYANADGVFVRVMRSGETRALRTPRDYIVDQLEWFADGTKLVASGFFANTYVPSVWTISIDGAPPHLVREMARQGSPSPDGSYIAFVSIDRSSIWVTRADGAQPQKVLDASGGDSFPIVFWVGKRALARPGEAALFG